MPQKKNGEVQVQLFNHTAQLPSDWDGCLPQKHFLRSVHLAVYERMQLPDVSYVYALISQNNKTIGVAYFQVLSIKERHLDAKTLSPLQGQAWKAFTKVLRPRLLVAGHLFRHDICSFFWSDELTAFEAFGLYQTAIQKAMRHSCASAVLVKDVNVGLVPYFLHYTPQYLLLRNDISMEMELPREWQTTQDYEKSLKHKYAQRFRKVRQHWQQLEIKELSAADTETNKEVLFHLYEQVSSRQQVRLGCLNENFLPCLKRENPQLRIWLASENGVPVAFFSAWDHGAVFDMFYIGFDYAKNDALQLYFNILFFSVEQSIVLQKSKLILGRTALEAKARLGCKPRYLSTYLYIRNPVLRNIISRLQSNITGMEGEWENRHPFKNPPSSLPDKPGD